MDALLAHLLTASAHPPPTESIDAWRATWLPITQTWDGDFERAVVAGFAADRLGFAFAGGYTAAIRRLVGDPGADVSSLCVTEQGGAHPRAIHTRLEGDAVTGAKKWSTMAPAAVWLFVAASRGTGPDGRNQLSLVRVAASDPGVTITPMPATPFTPEIPHAEVQLDGARAHAVLPGDGYTDYIKPFRTVEDIHVHAALVGHVIQVARRCQWPRDLVERLTALVVALGSLAAVPPLAPATHIALAGALATTRALLRDADGHWDACKTGVRERWRRDVGLLTVAGRARDARRDAAWRAVGRELAPAPITGA